MRDDSLNAILAELNSATSDVEGSAILTVDGLVQAAALPADMDGDRLGAMGAAMLSLGARTARDLVRGELEQVIVKGRDGYVVLTQAGPTAVLAVLCKAQVKLGLVLLDARRAADAVQRLLAP